MRYSEKILCNSKSGFNANNDIKKVVLLHLKKRNITKSNEEENDEK